MRRGRTVLGILLLLSVAARPAAAQGKAAAPVFIPPPGTYPAPLSVTHHHRHGRRDDLLHDRRLQPVAQDEPGLHRADPAHRHDDAQGVRLQEGLDGERGHRRRLQRQRAAAAAVRGRRHALPRHAHAADRRHELRARAPRP